MILVATDLLDPPAEAVGLLLRCRWPVRLRPGWSRSSSASSSTCWAAGTRWPHNPNGTRIQAYTAIICRLPIALHTGRKPTPRTYEMLCHHPSGLATADELAARVAGLQKQPG